MDTVLLKYTGDVRVYSHGSKALALFWKGVVGKHFALNHIVRHRNLHLERQIGQLTRLAANAGGSEREVELLRQVKQLKAQIKPLHGLEGGR